ncbi:transposase [Salmonella enterica]|nr:transposase [Salmonella enterica]
MAGIDSHAKDAGVPLLTSVARTLHKRLYRIPGTMKQRVSGSSAESLNGKNTNVQNHFRGYRNKERFKVAVVFHCGRLNMGLCVPTRGGEDS